MLGLKGRRRRKRRRRRDSLSETAAEETYREDSGTKQEGRDVGGAQCGPGSLRAGGLQRRERASRLDGLRLKLEKVGYANITYIVVNSQDENSRRLHPLLAQRLSEGITLYGQEPEAPDVWQIANVVKDDFQIYDRCGRLTHHLSLPYTILSQPYVEDAIRSTYCDGICGECTMESSVPQECNSTAKEKPEEETPRAEEGEAGHSHSPEIGHGHHGHHGGHHGHQRGQHRGHHGSGGTHSHDGSDHQHGHQGQVVVVSQVQRGQVDSGHPQVAHKHVDLGQVGLGLDFDQVEARNPLVMQQP
ncbi:hypothetical protein SRHO_G00329430 [Serrasalmus rhombeus]